jgi:hypothetical protein
MNPEILLICLFFLHLAMWDICREGQSHDERVTLPIRPSLRPSCFIDYNYRIIIVPYINYRIWHENLQHLLLCGHCDPLSLSKIYNAHPV